MDTAYIKQIGNGDAGTDDTVKEIYRQINNGSINPAIREQAVALVYPYQKNIERVQAIFDFLVRNMSYVKDHCEIETLYTPETHSRHLNEIGVAYGDCDDHTIFAGALLNSVGYPVRVVVIRGKAGYGPYDHVYLETMVDGRWIPIDATAKKFPFGWSYPNPSRKKVY